MGSEEATEEPRVHTPTSSGQEQKQKGNKTNRGGSTGRESRGMTTMSSRENSKL